MKGLLDHDYEVVATQGTAEFFQNHGLTHVDTIKKVHEGSPNIVDAVENGEVHFILNIPTDHVTRNDALEIRLAAVKYNIPYFTTLAAAKEAFQGMLEMRSKEIMVYSISGV